MAVSVVDFWPGLGYNGEFALTTPGIPIFMQLDSLLANLLLMDGCSWQPH